MDPYGVRFGLSGRRPRFPHNFRHKFVNEMRDNHFFNPSSLEWHELANQDWPFRAPQPVVNETNKPPMMISNSDFKVHADRMDIPIKVDNQMEEETVSMFEAAELETFDNIPHDYYYDTIMKPKYSNNPAWFKGQRALAAYNAPLGYGYEAALPRRSARVNEVQYVYDPVLQLFTRVRLDPYGTQKYNHIEKPATREAFVNNKSKSSTSNYLRWFIFAVTIMIILQML